MWAVVLITAGSFAAYWYSVWRRPYRRCKRCAGRKANISTTWWAGTYGRCHACNGSGDRIRWGVRYLTPKAYADIKSGKKGKNY
jgi:hypothetical protein